MSDWTPKLKTLLLTSGALTIAASLMIFPKASYEASLRGLEMWWNVVFPSLLPFFIVSELLIGFGVVNVIGILFEPFMRPLFRVPGLGGFVWAMGLASGYPAGAKLTARLRQENQLTKFEAERLSSFTNFSNPLFMFGAVAIGFFHRPALGLLLAVSHYLGNFCVGLVMRFHGPEENRKIEPKKSLRKRLTVRHAFNYLHTQRLRDKRPLGKLFGDAVNSSISTLLVIGGFIILFSVIHKVFSLLHLTNLLSAAIGGIMLHLHLPPEISRALVAGFFEITLGSQTASQIHAPLLFKAAATSFVLAFSGFSVQAQVASILADTDIDFKPFFIARWIHGLFSSVLTLLLWNPLFLHRATVQKESTVQAFSLTKTQSWLFHLWQLILHYGAAITFTGLIAFIFFILYASNRKFPV